MSEPDLAWVQREHPLHELGSHRQRLSHTIHLRPNRESIGAELRGGVVALSGHDDDAVSALHHERLMSSGVPNSGHQEHAGQHLGLSVEFGPSGPQGVDEVRQRVVHDRASVVQLHALSEEGHPGQLRVAAAMVEVEMTVRGHGHLRAVDPDLVERGFQFVASRAVVRINLGGRAHPRVEQEGLARLLDHISEASLNSGLPILGLGPRPHKVAEVDSSQLAQGCLRSVMGGGPASSVAMRPAPTLSVSLALMPSSDLWDDATASTYDADASAMFAPAVLDPAVALLADLAGSGRALGFAIGTGRLGIPLRRAGIPVSGIDLSPAMVARLRAKVTEDDLPVTVGDMATVTVPGEFSLVFLPWNSISNLRTQAEQVACFRNAARHLSAGGHFVVELFVPPLRRLVPGQVAVPFDVSEEHTGFDTFDVVEQSCTSHHYTRTPDGSIRYGVGHFRYIWPAECDLMAQLAGLELVARYGDWDRSPFTADSEKHVSVWRKAASNLPTTAQS